MEPEQGSGKGSALLIIIIRFSKYSKVNNSYMIQFGVKYLDIKGSMT